MNGEPRRAGFTQRPALVCARHPWWTIGVWLVALAVCGAVYLTMGDVFTSSVRFLNDPDSKKAADLIQQRGGGGGSLVAQAGSAVRDLVDGLDGAGSGARRLAKGSKKLSSGAEELQGGLRKLATGAGELSRGTRSAGAGAAQLSRGLSGVARGADGLSSGLRQVGGATGSLSGGLARLSAGGSEVASGAGKLAGGAKDLAAGARSAAQGVDKAAASAEQIAGGASTLEQVVAGREERLAGFRAGLEPLRSMLSFQPFNGGDSPLFGDYIVFGAFQWVRVISAYAVLAADDPVAAWFERCLDLHGGLGRRAPAAA